MTAPTASRYGCRGCGVLFLVATNMECEAEAVASAEDFVFVERIGATAGTADAPVQVVDIDDDVIAWHQIGGMQRREQFVRTKATCRELEGVVAPHGQIAAAFVVECDIRDVAA